MIDSALYILPIALVMGMAPFALMMMTPYLRMSIVLSLVRNALGVQQVPPAMVLNGLAIVMTLFIMHPVINESYSLYVAESAKYTGEEDTGNFDLTEMLDTAAAMSPPWISFLEKHADPKVSQSLMLVMRKIWTPDKIADLKLDSFVILLPSFTITEMTKAFQIGFLLYLPFVIIDLVVSNILLALGMMMVSPITISLPLKLLLFVILDGWFKVSQGLMLGFG